MVERSPGDTNDDRARASPWSATPDGPPASITGAPSRDTDEKDRPSARPSAFRSGIEPSEGREGAARLGVDVALLELLVCPLGGGPLVLDAASGTLVSRRARLAYPIRDGVPILVPAEATPIDERDPRLHPRPG